MVGMQDMTSDQVRGQSASIPPNVGAEPGTTTDQQLNDQYLAGLIKRTAQLPLDVIQAKQCSEQLIHGNRAFDRPKSVSIGVPESASTANLSAPPKVSAEPECQPITTLMLCGIPCRLGLQEIIDVIDEKGFSAGLCLSVVWAFDKAFLWRVVCSVSDNACLCLCVHPFDLNKCSCSVNAVRSQPG